MVFDLVTMSPITHLIKPRHFHLRKQPLSKISSHLAPSSSSSLNFPIYTRHHLH